MTWIEPKYEVVRFVRNNGESFYKIKKSVFYIFYTYVKDWSTATSIDMSGGYTVDDFTFKTCKEAMEKKKDIYEIIKAQKRGQVKRKETIKSCADIPN